VPVGGVINSEAILPDVVGNDIACSVLLTVTDMAISDAQWFQTHRPSLEYVLRNASYFGQQINPEPVVHQQQFYQESIPVRSALGTRIYASVHQMARTQFGTSGDGNHFVEFGVSDGCFRNGHFVRDGKQYLAILSHFGSRVIGSTIARAFQEHAQQSVTMPTSVGTAPLFMHTAEGADYWHLMQWAGEFAEQGHRWLHTHLLQELGSRVSLSFRSAHTVYSKHNFAWETSQGFVHRKGATPAAAGQFGIIPATMGDRSQIVLGLGLPQSYESASHGAGRTHSRRAAFQAFRGDTAAWLWKNHKVMLIGGGPDEDPRAYKNITDVMQAQADAVQSIGVFEPKLVRMADPRF
jgi:tRNA-splicing ligase RtcB